MHVKDSSSTARTSIDQLRIADQILRHEAAGLLALADRLGEEFCQAVDLIFSCPGDVIVCGIGKAGHVGQKLSATFASTGTPSQFLHPGEAMHGDLGRVRQDDLVVMLSNSGESEEIVRLLPILKNFALPIIAVTSCPASTLGRAATVTVDMGVSEEACSLGLAPSTSTTVMLAIGDAIALVVSQMRCFRDEDFAKFHPGGSLGRKLAKVEDVMRPIDDCCVAQDGLSVREIYVRASRPQRRTGAILLTDERGQLSGIFTDSDLARLFENKQEAAIDAPIREVMTESPISISTGTRLSAAVDILAERKISELPIVNNQGRPVGLIDITDVIQILPREKVEQVKNSSKTAPATETLSLPKRRRA